MNNIAAIQARALAQLTAQRALNPGLNSAAPLANTARTAGAEAPVRSSTEVSFSNAFKQALTSVSAAQAQASDLQNKVQLGAPGASLEETMLAMQKAQIGFQATLTVRNRMVQAYSDIMNMQV